MQKAWAVEEAFGWTAAIAAAAHPVVVEPLTPSR
jgi:hypothetical protein